MCVCVCVCVCVCACVCVHVQICSSIYKVLDFFFLLSVTFLSHCRKSTCSMYLKNGICLIF